MKLKRVPAEGAMILEVTGKIMGGPDHERFKAEIKTLIEEGHRHVILDFSSVPWINSTGLGILISGYTSLRAAEGSMKICNVTGRVMSIFYISQLQTIFHVYPTRAEALASY